MRRLNKELELVRWEHAAESMVYTEVVDDMSSRWSQLNIDSQVTIVRRCGSAAASESGQSCD